MKIEKKLLPKSIIELIVEETVEEVAKNRKKALEYLEKNANIKWFRKWAKIPESVLVREFWEEHINWITIDFSIDDIYKKALRKEQIIPVAQAEIKEIISQNPLKIRIHIEVFPEIKINEKYKSIKLKKKINEVTHKEVENALNEIQEKFTKFEEVTDEKYWVKMWDKVTIDTDWYEKEKLLENTSMRNYPLVLWTNILVPWFEESIVWWKLNEELSFEVNFPKDYHNEEFKGKKTTFKVKIHKIEKANKPEFTLEFIEQLRGKKLDLNWFKELIKLEIQDVKDSNTRLEEESKLVEELMKYTTIDIWDSMIKNQVEKVFSEIKENIKNDWYKVSDYLESLKMSEEDYKEKNVKPVALKRLNWELIFHKLKEIEKIDLAWEEINKEIEKILEKFSSTDVLEKLKNLYVPWTKYYEELKIRIEYRKLIDSFFE